MQNSVAYSFSISPSLILYIFQVLFKFSQNVLFYSSSQTTSILQAFAILLCKCL